MCVTRLDELTPQVSAKFCEVSSIFLNHTTWSPASSLKPWYEGKLEETMCNFAVSTSRSAPVHTPTLQVLMAW